MMKNSASEKSPLGKLKFNKKPAPGPAKKLFKQKQSISPVSTLFQKTERALLESSFQKLLTFDEKKTEAQKKSVKRLMAKTMLKESKIWALNTDTLSIQFMYQYASSKVTKVLNLRLYQLYLNTLWMIRSYKPKPLEQTVGNQVSNNQRTKEITMKFDQPSYYASSSDITRPESKAGHSELGYHYKRKTSSLIDMLENTYKSHQSKVFHRLQLLSKGTALRNSLLVPAQNLKSKIFTAFKLETHCENVQTVLDNRKRKLLEIAFLSIKASYRRHLARITTPLRYKSKALQPLRLR